MATKKPNILILFGDDIGWWKTTSMGKGMTAMKASKYLPISAACLMVFAAATPAMAQSGNSGPSVTIETTSASLLVGGQSAR